jgi:hypothetical protein
MVAGTRAGPGAGTRAVRERLCGRHGTGGPWGRFGSSAGELALAQGGAGARVPSELAVCGAAQRGRRQARERRCAGAERAAQRAQAAAAVRVAQEHGRVSAAQVRCERARGGMQELVAAARVLRGLVGAGVARVGMGARGAGPARAQRWAPGGGERRPQQARARVERSAGGELCKRWHGLEQGARLGSRHRRGWSRC